MCGIAGWLGRVSNPLASAQRMTSALQHRGPDSQGLRVWPDATLCHTRLSILDLSQTGAQPMANEDGSLWMVFNGEIYNHRVLRQDLESRGHRFRGRSDSEVLPHLYEEYGTAFVEKLRGMFAGAIYDSRRRTVILFRDRFGIKPLFYAVGPAFVAFASELQALLDFPDVDIQPDDQAIHDFLALAYIPAPSTFYKGIRALEPGCWLEARLGGDGAISATARSFHTWTVGGADDADEEVVENTERLINDAVNRQLESDVPLGSLLSGGIDSSLVSRAAQASLAETLRTFNVRFGEAGYDETWAARRVADHIGSHHLTLDIDQTPGTWQHVTELLLHAGQPFADTSLFAVNAVCKTMREHVTVALSGDGGDEGFGGYDTYWRIGRILRIQSLFRRGGAPARAMLRSLAAFGGASQRVASRLMELKDADNVALLQSLFCWIGPDEHRQLLERDSRLLPVTRWFTPRWDYRLASRRSPLETLSAQTTEVFTRLTLAGDFLFKVDIASMRHGLEVRVPMLDEDLFAYGLTLPHTRKVRGRRCKTVLRAVASRWLPRDVAEKSKRGFAVPVDSWVTADFRTRYRETLLASSSGLRDYLRPEAYEPLVKAFADGDRLPTMSRQGTYQRAIMLLALHLNLERVHALQTPRTHAESALARPGNEHAATA